MPSLSEIHLARKYLATMHWHGDVLIGAGVIVLILMIIFVTHVADGHRSKGQLLAYCLTIAGGLLIAGGMNEYAPFIPQTPSYVDAKICNNRTELKGDNLELESNNYRQARDGSIVTESNIQSCIKEHDKDVRYDSYHYPQKPLHL